MTTTDTPYVAEFGTGKAFHSRLARYNKRAHTKSLNETHRTVARWAKDNPPGQAFSLTLFDNEPAHPPVPAYRRLSSTARVQQITKHRSKLEKARKRARKAVAAMAIPTTAGV